MRWIIGLSFSGSLSIVLILLQKSGKGDAMIAGILLVSAIILGLIGSLTLLWGWIWSAQSKTCQILRFLSIIIVVLSSFVWFGIWVWPTPQPIIKETPKTLEKRDTKKGKVEKKDRIVQVTPSETKKNPLENRPYFAIYGTGLEIKTTPQLQMEMNVKNTGKHVAVNLFNRYIMIDQQFQMKPDINDSSEGNEVPPDTPHTWVGTLELHYKVMVPVYVIFAIKYSDKNTPSPKILPQIWYFKTMESWVGRENGTLPPRFYHASILERQDILNHLRDELKDYLE